MAESSTNRLVTRGCEGPAEEIDTHLAWSILLEDWVEAIDLGCCIDLFSGDNPDEPHESRDQGRDPTDGEEDCRDAGNREGLKGERQPEKGSDQEERG